MLIVQFGVNNVKFRVSQFLVVRFIIHQFWPRRFSIHPCMLRPWTALHGGMDRQHTCFISPACKMKAAWLIVFAFEISVARSWWRRWVAEYKTTLRGRNCQSHFANVGARSWMISMMGEGTSNCIMSVSLAPARRLWRKCQV